MAWLINEINMLIIILFYLFETAYGWDDLESITANCPSMFRASAGDVECHFDFDSGTSSVVLTSDGINTHHACLLPFVCDFRLCVYMPPSTFLPVFLAPVVYIMLLLFQICSILFFCWLCFHYILKKKHLKFYIILKLLFIRFARSLV